MLFRSELGSSTASIAGYAEKLFVNLSGASLASLNVSCRSCEIYCADGTDINLTGNAEQVSLTAASASNINASDFLVRKMEASATGASSIRVWVGEDLEAKASTASSIRYKGNPEFVNFRSVSAGSIRKE